MWRRVASHSDLKQSMIQYYNEKGLTDIRIYLAPWIEERIMSERINSPSTELYERIANQFYEELKQKIIALSSDNLMKFRIPGICTSLSQTPAVDLYTHLRSGLQREVELLEQMTQYSYMSGIAVNGVGSGSSGMLSVGSNIPIGMHTAIHNSSGNVGNTYGSTDLYTLHGLISKLDMDISSVYNDTTQFRASYATFQTCCTSYNQSKLHLPPQEIQSSDLQLQEQCSILNTTRHNILADLNRIISTYNSIQGTVITELKNWQRSQALAGNGAPFRDNLEDIQRCIELLVQMVGKILDTVTLISVSRLDKNDDVSEVVSRVRQAQQMLVLSSFIVEKQPPQVMKTNTRFAAGVRWLIGPQLGISVSNPTVECIILSEAQAQRHSAQRTMSDPSTSGPSSSGEIVNNIGTMEYNNQTRVFSASFRTMQLKKIKRAEKKGTESVMDEKFALLFFTSIIVNDYRIKVWTISLPVVVIVHGNQEPQSWATITWDNAFSDIVREPFQVPERVAWSHLANALNTKFESATGRALTEENLTFLHEKLFRAMSADDDCISWAQFCKEPLPDRAFTFWDWFFAIMKLTKDHLLNLWKAGLIVGFINKRKAEDMLRILPMGSFLLRFSDSELGGITIGFVTEQTTVLMLTPWVARDLNIRGLADRIHDIQILRIVYPTNRMRDDAFGEFYTQRSDENPRPDGYVANTIRVNVPSIEGVCINTPQHNIQSPHPQDMQMGNNGNNNISLNDLDIYTNGINDTPVDWDMLCIL